MLIVEVQGRRNVERGGKHLMQSLCEGQLKYVQAFEKEKKTAGR